MMIHPFQLLAAKLPRVFGIVQQRFGSALSVQSVQLDGEFVLLATAKAITPLTLKLDVLLVPPCNHTRAAHEVPSIHLAPMAAGMARPAISKASLIRRPEADVLAEYAVKLLHRRAPVVPRLAGWCTGCVASGLARPS